MSAKAIGSLMKSLGEEEFPDFVDWTIAKLEEEGNSVVERSRVGSAIFIGDADRPVVATDAS
eukprot:gene13-7267_t